MNFKISILVQDTVLANEISKEIKEKYPDNVELLHVEIKRRETGFRNATGGLTEAITLLINDDFAKAIFEGVVGNLAFESLKCIIKITWKSLRNNISKRHKDKSKAVENANIKIQIADANKTGEIILSGKIGEDQIDKLGDEFFTLFSKDNINKISDNKDFLENLKSKPKIRIIFNEQTQMWEPFNFGKSRKELEELKRLSQQHTND